MLTFEERWTIWLWFVGYPVFVSRLEFIEQIKPLFFFRVAHVWAMLVDQMLDKLFEG